MSTFLVCSGVVAATIAAVLYVILSGPDQPPTIRLQPVRAKPRRSRRDGGFGSAGMSEAQTSSPPTPGPAVAISSSSTPAFALPDSDVMRLRVLPAAQTTVFVRIRSGVVLAVLVAVLGALLALAVGGLTLGAALLIRSATG